MEERGAMSDKHWWDESEVPEQRRRVPPPAVGPPKQSSPRATPEEWRKMIDDTLKLVPKGLREELLLRRARRRREGNTAPEKAVVNVTSATEAVAVASKILKPMPGGNDGQ